MTYVWYLMIFVAIFWACLHPLSSINIELPFGDIDGATPAHSPKSGRECPHRWLLLLLLLLLLRSFLLLLLTHRKAFTQRSVYAEKLLHTASIYSTHGSLCTQQAFTHSKHLHTRASICTQELLSTHGSFHTQQAFTRKTLLFTHRSYGSRTCWRQLETGHRWRNSISNR